MYLYYLALHIFLRLFSTQLTTLLFLALASSAFLHFSILKFVFTRSLPFLFPSPFQLLLCSDITGVVGPGPIPGGSGSTGSGCSLPLGTNAWECFQALLGCRCGPEESQIRDLQAEEQLPPAGRKLLTGLSKAKSLCFIWPEINTDFEPCEIYIHEFILSSNKGGTLVFKFQQSWNFAQCL